MKAYITGKGLVSAIGSGEEPLTLPSVTARYMTCQKPDFTKYFEAKQARRTSKILKMGLVAAYDALGEDKEHINGIMVGTGLGCISDSEKFITALIKYDESMLSPTPFIQSTHNTIAGSIALQLKVHQYNFTYSERIFSFEWTLLDALMQLDEVKTNQRFLVGSADELTNNTFDIAKSLKIYRDYDEDQKDILKSKYNQSFAGEHAAFFTLEKEADNAPVLQFVKMFFQQKTSIAIAEIKAEIEKSNIGTIDTVLMGISGHQIYDQVYEEIENSFLESNLAYFKHLSGENLTSSSFAFWLATEIIEKDELPSIVTITKKTKSNNNVLIINHLKRDYLSAILISK